MYDFHTPPQSGMIRLLVLKHSIKLELSGMTRRGRSATAVARELLGIKAQSRQTVLAALEQYIEDAQAGKFEVDERGVRI